MDKNKNLMQHPASKSRPFSTSGVRQFLARTYKSRFVRSVAVVASGTAGAQAITMAFSPLITRLYGPEAFGLLGVFMALVAVLTPVSALSYPIAIVLPRSDSDAKGIAGLSAYIALVLAFLVTVILIAAGDWILGLLDAEEISRFALFLPVAMLFTGLMQIAKHWVIRKQHFGIAARAEVLHALLVNTAKVGIGWFYPLAAVLIVLSTAGKMIHVGLLAMGIRRTLTSATTAPEETERKDSLWKLAKKHHDFPLYRAPQSFINAISQELPTLMLAAFFGPASAGFYAICRRVLALPVTLISKSVGDVFYPRITEAAHKDENLSKMILKATLYLAAVGFFPFAVIIVFGPWLFGFVFGAEWSVAGEYARWLALWMFFMFINRPSVVSLPVLKLQGFFLIYELSSVILRIVALFIGGYILNNDIMAILLFSLAGVFLNVSLICCTVIAGGNFRNRSHSL